MFTTYLDVDPKSGKKKRTTRRVFETKKEAKLALARLELRDNQYTPKNQMQKKYITFPELTISAIEQRYSKGYSIDIF